MNIPALYCLRHSAQPHPTRSGNPVSPKFLFLAPAVELRGVAGTNVTVPCGLTLPDISGAWDWPVPLRKATTQRRYCVTSDLALLETLGFRSVISARHAYRHPLTASGIGMCYSRVSCLSKGEK